MASKYFDLVEVTKQAQEQVDRSFRISDQIKKYLVSKFLTIQIFADAMWMSYSDAAEMLSGCHDFTEEEINKINETFSIKILL